MILVVGATGTNGRQVVGRLVEKGEHVTALVRNPAKSEDLRAIGAEIVTGDLDDAASLQSALQGVDRAFFLAPVDQRYTSWFSHFMEAAKKNGSPHIVKFSGMGAGVESPSELMRQHGETDEALAKSGLPYTIIRPNSFYQNLFWSAATIKDHGAFYLPIGNGKQSLVDVRDIADVAVQILTTSGHEGKTYEITGPEALTYHQVAEKLSRVVGKLVRYVDVSPQTAHDSMLKSGMPEWNATALVDLYGVFAAGKAEQVTDTVARLTGRQPRSFEQFAEDFVERFR